MSGEVKWYGKKLIDEAKVQLGKNMDHIGVVLSGEMRALINRGSRTGRIYFKRRGKKGKRGKVGKGWKALNSYMVHQASAPGEPPKTDKGDLVKTITYEVKRPTPMIFQCRVGTNSKIGFWLEFGTKRIKPRPFARPTLHKFESKLPGMVTKDLV
jgi:hypothetical protein